MAGDSDRRNHGPSDRFGSGPGLWSSAGLLAFFFIVSAFQAIALAPPSGSDRPEHPGTRHVLVLYSDQPLLRANILFDEQLRKAFATASGAPIECHSEFLDEVRFPARHQERTREFLLAKYGNTPPDLIVTFARSSLEFCLQSRSSLFPDAPIVFAAVGTDVRADEELGPRVTGVRSVVGMAETLRMALRLHPDTERVIVIADSTDFDGPGAPSDLEEIEKQYAHVGFDRIPARSPARILEALAQLPPHRLVLYLSSLGELPQNTFPPHALVDRMSQIAEAPIYAVSDAYLGQGIVGAVTTPTETMAQETARLATQILNGARDATPPVRTLGAVPMFDWKQMQRWGLRRKELPPGSLVLFAPPSLWQQHARWVIAIVAVFLVQSGLILALVIQSVRRGRAEREALRRRQELAHTTRVATVGELTASLAHEINQPLAAILSNAQAAQRLMDGGVGTQDDIREILADIVADDQRAGQVIRRMRSFLRKEVSEPAILDVNSLVAEVAGLVHGEMILQNVGLALHLSATPAHVHGDRVQLQQVLLNLIMNALDAMKDTTGSDRKIQVRSVLQERTVRVSVVDSGVGVPADSVDHIFDRFVTTKPHGLGLGLSICRSIVEAHGGRVGLTRNPDRGATFWFALPAVEKDRA